MLRPGGRRAVAPLAVVLVTTVLVLVGGGGPASAHAYLAGSDPADGARLEAAPPALRLELTEHVVLGASRLVLVDGDGHRVPLTRPRLLTAGSDSEQPSTLVAELPVLRPGAYRLTWQTLSADDLHATGGALVFGVGTDVTAAGPSRPRTSWPEALVRAALLAASALALGGLLAARVLGRAHARASGALRLAAGAALSAPVLAGALLMVQLGSSGSSGATLLSGGYGARWLLRWAGLVLLAAGSVGRLRSSGRATPWTFVAVTGGALAALGTAALGHLGAGTAGPVRLLVASEHLGAALTWAGAVGVLGVVLVRERHVLDGAERVRVLRAFGLPAAACLGVAAVTGVLLAGDVVGSLDSVLLTTYGRTLLLKVVLVAVAASLGLRHHRLLRTRGPVVAPRRGVLAEALVLLGVVGATGVLGSSGTATDPAYLRQPPADDVAVGRRLEDLQVEVALSPNRPGTGLGQVQVFDTRRPAPAPVTGVDLRVGDGAWLPTTVDPAGSWTAPTEAGSGRTTLVVRIHRAGLDDVSGRFAWTVGSAGRPRPVLVSDAPLDQPLRLAAGLLALGAGLGAAASWQRRRRQQIGVGAADGSGLGRADGVADGSSLGVAAGVAVGVGSSVGVGSDGDG